MFIIFSTPHPIFNQEKWSINCCKGVEKSLKHLLLSYRSFNERLARPQTVALKQRNVFKQYLNHCLLGY